MHRINKMKKDMNQLPRIQTTLVFLLNFSCLQVFGSAATSKSHNMEYFIICGSNTNIVLSDGRTFEGDLNIRAVTFSEHGSIIETNPKASKSNNTLSLYQTARVFQESSLYKFDIKDKGIYILRIHFFAFQSSLRNLSAARFSVAASSPIPSSVYSLLNDFSVGNIKNSEFHIMEFFLNIEVGEFSIYFIPEASSFAFVNAIEVLLPDGNIFPHVNEGVQLITPQGGVNYLNDTLRSNVLQTVHRINAGGPEIKPDRDALWRRWNPDDGFLVDPKAAETKSRHVSGNDPNYAPDAVFQDARVMKTNSSNISWCFEARKNARYFVRAHFYDVSGSLTGPVSFKFYIYQNFSDSVSVMLAPSPPIYNDYIIESDGYGFLNFSIIPDKNVAFLNGLEIMEMTNNLRHIPPAKSWLVFVVVGAVLAGLILVFISVLLTVIFFIKRQRKLETSETSIWTNMRASTYDKMTDASTHSPIHNLNLGLKIPFAEIKIATKNFDWKMIIGKGGFGKVYKGTLRGDMVAVKRSHPGSEQGLSEFHTEIILLSKIRHKHLVSLFGYCDENLEKILVYEYVEKGTLREHLYGSNLPCLSWKQRLEICVGAARGIHYLHSGFAGGIIHRDVKSTNILLDANYVAKVADFGISKSGCLDQTHVTTGLKGTIGYFDPEYLLTEQLTEKSDVYSFGVVLLEVLCARKPIDNSLPRDQANLALWGVYHIKKGLLEEIVDPMLAGLINPSSLRKFSEIAAKCLEDCGDDRPSMGDVVWDLEYALQLQQTGTHGVGEPYSESFTNVSSELSVFNVQKNSSFSSMIPEGRMLTLKGHDTELGISEVFSEP